jgi:starch-binding outer membrane protein, SusD/RagB family
MKTRILKRLSIFLLVSQFIACEGLLSPEPEGFSVLDVENATDLAAILDGAYAPLSDIYDRPMFIMADASSDDLYIVGDQFSSSGGFDMLDIPPTDGILSDMWKFSYQVIYRCNIVLDNVSLIEYSSSERESGLEKIIEGQARFLRALMYYNLVRFWGDVPLIIEPIEKVNDDKIARSSILDVYNFIKNEFAKSAELLPELYSGKDNFEKGRATKGAAKSILSLVHLSLEEWSDAVNISKEVINSGIYSIDHSFSENFGPTQIENNAESIFEIQFSDLNNTGADLRTFNLPNELGGNARVFVTNDTVTNIEEKHKERATGNGLLQAFLAEDNNNRMDVSISNYGFGGAYQIYKYFSEIKIPDFGASPVNYMVMRYAEVMLIAAEALNELSYPSAEAFSLLNAVRNRVNLPVYNETDLSTQDSFRKAVWKERRLELAGEGHRFFDLNRTGRVKEIAIIQNINVKRIDNYLVSHPITGKQTFLMPLPQYELDNNELLIQNPGY